ncbi:MAG: hypothetical protein ACRD43_00485 [Pyrinomonadaceae bacterium]
MARYKLVILALTLFLCGSIYSQSEQKKPEAFKFAEFQSIKSDALCEKVSDFYSALRKNESTQGFIINYGSATDIRKRRDGIVKCINFRDYDTPRVTFVDGPVEPKVRTVFWLVPNGADDPTP